MDQRSSEDWSITRRRLGRYAATVTLLVFAASTGVLAAESGFRVECAAGVNASANPGPHLRGCAVECLTACDEEAIDRLEDDDLASGLLLAPSVMSTESRGAFSYRPTLLADKLQARSKPARGPPSA